MYTHVRGNLVTRLKRLSLSVPLATFERRPDQKQFRLNPPLCAVQGVRLTLPLFFLLLSFRLTLPHFREPFSCAKIAPVSAKGQCTVRELADKKIQSRRAVPKGRNSEDPSFCPLSSEIPSTSPVDSFEINIRRQAIHFNASRLSLPRRNFSVRFTFYFIFSK